MAASTNQLRHPAEGSPAILARLAMNRTVFGLPVRWETSFDWRVIGSRAPRRLRDVVVARAGAFVVGLDPETGALRWKNFVADTLDGFVLEVCTDVVVSDWRDPVSKRGYLRAVDAQGIQRWEVGLVAGVGATAIKLDDRSLAAAVCDGTWEIVVVGVDGCVERLPLAYPGSHIARMSDGSWIVGSSGLARGKPPLFVMSNTGSRAVSDVAPQVLKVLCVGGQVVTTERTGENHEIVVRDTDLVVQHRTTVACDIIAVASDQMWVVTGERDRPVPTAIDLATGEVRWQGPALPTPAGRAVASGDVVLLVHEEGAVLLSVSGAVIGEHDGNVGRLDVTAGAIHLFVDGAVVCLGPP